MTAKADTTKAAENALKAKIAAGLPSQAEGDLNGQTKLKTVTEVWLAEIEQRQEHAPQTIEVYRDIVRRIILASYARVKPFACVDEVPAQRGRARARIGDLPAPTTSQAFPGNPVASLGTQP